jgi:hypothetical protein
MQNQETVSEMGVQGRSPLPGARGLSPEYLPLLYTTFEAKFAYEKKFGKFVRQKA